MERAENPAVMAAPERAEAGAPSSSLKSLWPFFVILAIALALPLTGNGYWALIATRVAIYWVLVCGLNLIVGFAGQLAIGYVALLTLGAYTTCVLVEGKLGAPLNPFVALCAAGAVGALFGVVVGLPALRLRTFYFAMTTIGFATIVTQIALGWTSVTGGGVGLPGPALPAPFDSAWGFYGLCLGCAVLATLFGANIAHSRIGRALVATRDADVAAEALGVSKSRLLVKVFLFAGALAGIAGGLFASLQTYITPDAFTFDLSLLFFTAILIGGRGSILGPLLGTIVLTVLPEIAAPLAAWSTFFYALLLLVIVLLMPGGIASWLDISGKRALPGHREVSPMPALLDRLLPPASPGARDTLRLDGVSLSFGGVRAIDGLSLEVAAGQVHGLIGPNGSGKTTTLNLVSGFYAPDAGQLSSAGSALRAGTPGDRAARGIARTFQAPRVVGEASVLQNVMMGGTITGSASFIETMLALPRQRREERALRERAALALRCVGLGPLAQARADRLQHSELRFVEIARALMLRPRLLLLDEPATGLSVEEIKRLGGLIKAISRRGTAVLLVEHHADLIFDICDHVTVLNLGKVLAEGTPAQIRVHKEVVSAYLGG
ncbi:MAG TPA: ATP-binding cassette domain-containing protein [Burkholderiaceae bacterium]|jgi:ABC-type branched-subunit amino acid transport system ATPase component/ABC-type branched-subunit amino acid transport system permease subunit